MTVTCHGGIFGTARGSDDDLQSGTGHVLSHVPTREHSYKTANVDPIQPPLPVTLHDTMSAPSASQQAFVTPRIVRRLASFVSTADAVHLLRVNRACFAPGARVVWAELDGLEPLFRLLFLPQVMPTPTEQEMYVKVSNLHGRGCGRGLIPGHPGTDSRCTRTDTRTIQRVSVPRKAT